MIFVERWDSDAFENQELSRQIYQDVKKRLKIIPHNFTGWRSYPNQKLKTISINENGLRDKSIQNFDNKKNCILLGGSVAWGFGASSNENILSFKIEEILKKKYNINFNVINLAEQSYSSIEELNSFIFSFHELNPSVVIIFSGCNDINYEYLNQYKKNFLYEDFLNFYLWGDKIGIFRERNFSKILGKVVFKFFKKDKKINDEFYYFKKPYQNRIALKMYNSKVDFIKNLCDAKKIPVFNILQPDLLFKKIKSKFEKSYEQFQPIDRKNFTKEKYLNLENEIFNTTKDTKYFKNLNLLRCFDEFNETIFIDRNHVADKGYQIIAEKISIFMSNKLSEFKNG